MPSRKTKRQLADEAYQRTAALAGQLDIYGSIVGEPNPIGAYRFIHQDVPERCPDCDHLQTIASGWTPLDRSVRHPAIQCGQCGAIIQTSPEAWEELRQIIRAHFAQLPQNQPKRARGAR